MTLNGSTLCRYEDKPKKSKNAKKSGMQKENGLQIVTRKKCVFCKWINVASIVIVLHSNG